MRVQWLSSAALLALIAAPGVFAQQVTASEPFTVKLSGFTRTGINMVTPTSAAKDAAGGLNSLAIVGKSRLNIDTSATVSGIGFGTSNSLQFANGEVKAEGPNQNLFISPMGIGKFTLGVAGYNTDYAGLDGSMLWGTNYSPDGGWGASATGFGTAGGVMADIVDATGAFANGGMWDGGNKVSYSTPNLMGLSATVAFQPSDSSAANTVDLTKNGKGTNNVIGAGASYTAPEMGGVTVTVAGAFLSGTPKTAAGSKAKEAVKAKEATEFADAVEAKDAVPAVIAGSKAFEDISMYQGRVGVSGYGVMAQFVYLGAGKSGQVAGSTGSDVTGMSASLAYAMGPAQVGGYYGSSTLYAGNKVTAIGGGASYNVAKGAQVSAGYETFTNKPKTGSSQTAGAATVAMVVNF